MEEQKPTIIDIDQYLANKLDVEKKANAEKHVPSDPTRFVKDTPQHSSVRKFADRTTPHSPESWYSPYELQMLLMLSMAVASPVDDSGAVCKLVPRMERYHTWMVSFENWISPFTEEVSPLFAYGRTPVLAMENWLSKMNRDDRAEEFRSCFIRHCRNPHEDSVSRPHGMNVYVSEGII